MMIRGNAKEVVVEVTCPFCGKVSQLTIPTEGYTAWKLHGVLVQDAFPQLSAEDRELLISGICPTCWGGYFGVFENDEYIEYDEEEEEDDDSYENDDWSEMGFDPYLGEYSWDC